MSRRFNQSRYDDSDSDDEPIYRGSRNYDGVGSSLGDAFNDLAVSVKNVAGKLVDESKRKEIVSSLQSKISEAGETLEKVKKDTSKAFEHAMRKDERGTNTSGMPDGCFCDMRGYACPKHRGREKWRQDRVYQQHIQHNFCGEVAAGGGEDEDGAAVYAANAAVADRLKADEDMAKLIAMGFDPDKVQRALKEHSTLDDAMNSLLDEQRHEDTVAKLSAARASAEANLISLDEPPPTPSLLELDPIFSSAPPAGLGGSAVLGEGLGGGVALGGVALGGVAVPGAAATILGGGGSGGLAPGPSALAAHPLMTPVPPEGFASTPPATPPPVPPPVLPPWRACVDAASGATYFFNTVTRQSQWEQPGTSAALPTPMAGGPVSTSIASPNTANSAGGPKSSSDRHAAGGHAVGGHAMGWGAAGGGAAQPKQDAPLATHNASDQVLEQAVLAAKSEVASSAPAASCAHAGESRAAVATGSARGTSAAVAPAASPRPSSQPQAHASLKHGTAAVSARPARPSHSPGLPAGWESGVDPRTGVRYYCNPVLQITQWERPT